MQPAAACTFHGRPEAARTAMKGFWKIYSALVLVAFVVMVAALMSSKPRRGQRAWQAQPERRPRAERYESAPVVTPPRPRPPKPQRSGPLAAPPRFSASGGVFTNRVSVELRATSPSAVVRYTVDGSEPDENSRPYSEPIQIHATTVVRAASFETNHAPSPVVSQTYTMLDEGLVKEFTSNLPVVIINTFNQRISRDEFVPVSARFIRPAGSRTSLLGSADFEGRGEIKRRGYSSLRLPKPSFTFKMREDGENTKASLYGLPADFDWVLYAPYADKTLLRDALAYELSNRMGRYAPRTRFVEVFVARGNGRLTYRDYQGVYVLIEKIRRAKDRVNIAKLGPDDNAEPAITGGYIFKRDHEDDGMGGGGPWRRFRSTASVNSEGESGFYTRRGMHLFYVDPKERELTAAQKQWLTSYMTDFERALYGSNFKSPTEGYARYLDVDSFIDHFWLVEMSKNIDGFRYSCFMHKDRGGKLKIEPAWDWNLSFGNANYHEGDQTEDWYYPLLRESEVSWFRRLVQDPDFNQRHIDRWAALRREVFAPENILKRVDEMAAELNQAQARNFEKWRILGRWVQPNSFVGDSYAEEINWMKTWIRRRIAWIDSQIPAAPTFSENENGSKSAGKVRLRARSGKIYYTLDGSDPRAPGGGVSDKARLYESALSINDGARLVARAQQGSVWSPPARLPRGNGDAKSL